MSAQTELITAQQQLVFVRTEKDAEISRLEGEAKQLEKQLMMVSNTDASKFNESENRLLQHGVAEKRSTVSQVHHVGVCYLLFLWSAKPA